MRVATLDPVSNRASWLEAVELTDQETGDLIDLTGMTIEVQVRSQMDRDSDGYTSAPTGGQMLSATTDDDTVTILDTGVFQFEFTKAQMGALAPDAYDIGAIITSADGDETAQIIIGTVSVLEGVVR